MFNHWMTTEQIYSYCRGMDNITVTSINSPFVTINGKLRQTRSRMFVTEDGFEEFLCSLKSRKCYIYVYSPILDMELPTILYKQESLKPFGIVRWVIVRQIDIMEEKIIKAMEDSKNINPREDLLDALIRERDYYKLKYLSMITGT